MRSPYLLLAILVCLTFAKLGDTTDANDLPADGSNGAAVTPVLVADGADDPGAALERQAGQFMRAFWGSLQNENPAPQSPSKSQTDPNPAAPEDLPEPVPKPDCSNINGKPVDEDYTPVCCINEPVASPGDPDVIDRPLFDPPIFWFLSLCSESGWNNHQGPCGHPWNIWCCWFDLATPKPQYVVDPNPLYPSTLYDSDWLKCFRPTDYPPLSPLQLAPPLQLGQPSPPLQP